MMAGLLLLAVGAAAGVVGTLGLWLWQAGRRGAVAWRTVLAVLPLPMLALAASYGVYSFSLLFVPPWVAVVSAAAFELTYIGLAVLIGLDERQRRRAGLISGGAVAVSILYNSLAGLFHRRPELLVSTPDNWWLDAALSVAHGLPLALVAYFVADLLLHRNDDAAQLAALLAQPTVDMSHSASVVRDGPAPPAALAAPDATQMIELAAPSAPAAALSAHACRKCGGTVASPHAVSASARWGCAACKQRSAS